MSPMWAGDYVAAHSAERGFADSAGKEDQRVDRGGMGEDRVGTWISVSTEA